MDCTDPSGTLRDASGEMHRKKDRTKGDIGGQRDRQDNRLLRVRGKEWIEGNRTRAKGKCVMNRQA